MRIGVDVGGTKIEAICLDRRGETVASSRIATPQTTYVAVLDAIAHLVGGLEATAGRHGLTVGVGTPGFLAARDGKLRNANLGILNGHPIDKDLERRLGRPVRVANDANCFVLSEAADGAAAGPVVGGPARAGSNVDIVFGATLGTGVGGGIVVDGRVLAGANGSAAEWSHATLPFWRPEDGPGGGCSCGRDACIESFLAGRGLVWSYHQSGGARDALGPEIADWAARGDETADAAFRRYEDRLARALAAVINLIDPRVVVLGGGISRNARLFENVPRLWGRYTVASDLVTRLVPARHGDASGVRGAAWLWPET